MKKGMCRGCDHFTKTPQERRFRPDGVTPLPKPRTDPRGFCIVYDLHIFPCVDQTIVPEDRVCQRYIKGGIS
jgi:hypothetical protein